MGQGFSIIRAFARLNALGALLGSGILLLICCIGTPTFDQFNFSTVQYNGTSPSGKLTAGLWGYCWTPDGGARTCSPSSVGYNMDPYNLTFLEDFGPKALPGIPNAPPGGANLNLINKPLSEALIFLPLATGAVWLALLPALLPIRIVTLLTIGIVFLAIGAEAISFVLALATFLQMNARVGVLTTNTSTVHPLLGRCLWYTLASLVATTGAFLFLLIALPPKKTSPRAPGAYREMVNNERHQGTDYSRRYSVEKHSRTPAGSGYGDARNGGSGVDRYGSRRSGAGSGGYAAASAPRRTASRSSRRSERSGRLRAELESDEEAPTSRPRSRGSRRTGGGGGGGRGSRHMPDSEEEVSDGY